MAFCSKCGTQLNEGAKFCHKCGNSVNEGSIRPQMSKQPEVIESNDVITQHISEEPETIISQLDVIYSTPEPAIIATVAFGPMIITDKRIIMSPLQADGHGNESKFNEMKVFWNDISNVKYSAWSGTQIYFHYVTKKGKEYDKLLVGPWSGLVQSISGTPVVDLNGKNRKGLYETIYSAWIKGR